MMFSLQGSSYWCKSRVNIVTSDIISIFYEHFLLFMQFKRNTCFIDIFEIQIVESFVVVVNFVFILTFYSYKHTNSPKTAIESLYEDNKNFTAFVVSQPVYIHAEITNFFGHNTFQLIVKDHTGKPNLAQRSCRALFHLIMYP